MIISVISAKGGSGKTTTAATLAAALEALTGRRPCLMDCDPQASLTYWLCGRHTATGPGGATVAACIRGSVKPPPAAAKMPAGDIIPAGQELRTAGEELVKPRARACMRDLIAGLPYSAVVIDTAPAQSRLTAEALSLSDACIITCRAGDALGLEGIRAAARTAYTARRDIRILGVLLTQYRARRAMTAYTDKQAEEIAKGLGARVFRARIRDTVAAAEAVTAHKSLLDYAPKSTAAQDYISLAAELMQYIQYI